MMKAKKSYIEITNKTHKYTRNTTKTSKEHQVEMSYSPELLKSIAESLLDTLNKSQGTKYTMKTLGSDFLESISKTKKSGSESKNTCKLVHEERCCARVWHDDQRRPGVGNNRCTRKRNKALGDGWFCTIHGKVVQKGGLCIRAGGKLTGNWFGIHTDPETGKVNPRGDGKDSETGEIIHKWNDMPKGYYKKQKKVKTGKTVKPLSSNSKKSANINAKPTAKQPRKSKNSVKTDKTDKSNKKRANAFTKESGENQTKSKIMVIDMDMSDSPLITNSEQAIKKLELDDISTTDSDATLEDNQEENQEEKHLENDSMESSESDSDSESEEAEGVYTFTYKNVEYCAKNDGSNTVLDSEAADQGEEVIVGTYTGSVVYNDETGMMELGEGFKLKKKRRKKGSK